jgi:hypothetical protein
MPLDSTLYLIFVISMFSMFAVVLAYAEWATRQATSSSSRHTEVRRERAANHDKTVLVHKKAA